MVGAFLAIDHRDRAINAMDAVRRSFERRRQTAERFALHAALINDKDTADFFTREAKLWAEAVDEVAVRIQVEAGL